MRQRLALLAALAALPLAATAGTMDIDLEPASIAPGPAGAWVEGSPDAEPPICNRIETDEATGETTVGCCWVFYNGKYWCVPC